MTREGRQPVHIFKRGLFDCPPVRPANRSNRQSQGFGQSEDWVGVSSTVYDKRARNGNERKGVVHAKEPFAFNVGVRLE